MRYKAVAVESNRTLYPSCRIAAYVASNELLNAIDVAATFIT
jgi:hypothetical protein